MTTNQSQQNQPTYHEPTFRTWPPETVDGPDGHPVTIQLCECLEDGRWEPFISQVPA